MLPEAPGYDGAMADVVARRYLVSGRVQGVGFRYFVEKHASLLGVAGWVRNLDDGRVEVHAQGPPEQLVEFEGRLWQGPRMAGVRGVEVKEAPMLQYGGFRIHL